MNSFEWFLLIVVVIVVPLTIAVVVTLWTIDQANKRKRANRKDPQIGVKRKAALSPEEVEAHKAARAEKQAEADSSGVATPSNSDSLESRSSVETDNFEDGVTTNDVAGVPSGDVPSQPGTTPVDGDDSPSETSDSGSVGENSKTGSRTE